MANLDIFLIDYEIDKENPKWWLEIIRIFLKPGLRFKGSFEKEHTSILEKLIAYGSNLKISYENNFIKVEGIINNGMIKDFKESYEVEYGSGIDYYSSFYSLEIGENYCSAHYGSEIYLTKLSEDELGRIYKIINSLDQYLKVDIS